MKESFEFKSTSQHHFRFGSLFSWKTFENPTSTCILRNHNSEYREAVCICKFYWKKNSGLHNFSGGMFLFEQIVIELRSK